MSAAISAQISLDELRKFVPKFVNKTTKEVGDELLRQATLMVRDNNDNGLLAITPPKDEAMGRTATIRDINRVFVTVASIRKILKTSGVRGAVRIFNRYIKPGSPDYSEAKALDFLNSQTPTSVEVRPYTTKKGKRVRSYTQTRNVSSLGDPRLGRLQYVGAEPSRELHKLKKNSRGRVNQAAWSQLVTSYGKMNGYVEKIAKRVGLLKAGWGVAARKAGLLVNLPPFASRNAKQASGEGRHSFANPSNMYVEMANTTPNASQLISKEAVNFVMRLRQDNIKRELERRIGALAKAA